ncbi:CcdB family protein [Pannonibacter sp.]|uniref:CcdB family protein n=1 Tax=Pannonibacter sp. TaxID=1906786 RepID=UPI003F719AAA
MARFQVRRLRNSPVLGLELQANLLDKLTTRVLAPLVPVAELGQTIRQINPVFEIDGVSYALLSQHISAVPLTEIGDVVAVLSRHSDAIVAATDFMFQGF